MIRYLLFGCALTISAFAMIGCEHLPESTFKLASESRLPKWVTLPPPSTRVDVSLTLSYYTKPWGGTAQFILQDANKRTIEKIDGKVNCKEPFQLKTSSERSTSGYPTYEPVTANGVTEIIEHRGMEPIFYVTDDPVVWNQYRALGCG